MSLEDLLASWLPVRLKKRWRARSNFDRLPPHIAVIMDGNGRWAAQRHLPRVEGHRAGIESVREMVEGSARLGIEVLTLYAFSVENWKRPATEVSTLMLLLKRYLRLELNTLLRNNIRFKVIGRAEDLAARHPRGADAAEAKTASNSGMLFNIALNYGGRAEIVEAARRMMLEGVARGRDRRAALLWFLYTAGQPDPDLLIRTSGEMRVSNFLLWQIAYAEIWVTDTLWPDFRQRTARGDPRVPEARSPLRRHQSAGGGRPVISRQRARLRSSAPLPVPAHDPGSLRARAAADCHRHDLVPPADSHAGARCIAAAARVHRIRRRSRVRLAHGSRAVIDAVPR